MVNNNPIVFMRFSILQNNVTFSIVISEFLLTLKNLKCTPARMLKKKNAPTPIKCSSMHSVSIVSNTSPFSNDRFLSSERKSPTCSPITRRTKSPMSTKHVSNQQVSPFKKSPEKPRQDYKVTFSRFDAVIDIDMQPNQYISLNQDKELAVALGIRVYLLKDNKEVVLLIEETENIDAVAWIQDKLLMSTGGKVYLIDVKRRQYLQDICSHTGRAGCIAISEHRIATGGEDAQINIVDYRTMSTQVLTGHSAEVLGLAWSPDQAFLASVDANGKVMLSGNKQRKRINIPFPVSSLAWITNSILACGGSNNEGTLALISILNKSEELPSIDTGAPISTVHWNPNRGIMVSHRGCSFEWELFRRDLSLIGHYSGHQGNILHITSNPDGTRAATLSLDGYIHVWTIEERNPLRRRSSTPAYMLR